MFELKSLTREAVPAAREKAHRYRLLNEPEQAESICHDVLRVDPADQEALATLILALTDRFVGPRPELFALADVVWVAHDRGGVEVALEAMAAGRPVVGAKTADLAELIEDGATGLLAARGDRPALAAKAKLLLDDAGLRQRIGEAGRARVRERFSVGRMVEQFARVYGELVG